MRSDLQDAADVEIWRDLLGDDYHRSGRQPTRSHSNWTPWQHRGNGDVEIGRVWWQARPLHFPKANVTLFFDGSEVVGEHRWGVHGDKWQMKRPPADWMPNPGMAAERDRQIVAFLERKRHRRLLKGAEVRT
ncbi:hypothetical protein EFV37_13120 [Mesorhizobium loti]|uniref:Uncharacterized protein n=1 Tax=Mesorhizobium jarvisii TaxID=1777867 RepID=A0A6M7TEJ3_9HYPH|nr:MULTISPECIES: hypothetical protein [Mesorhizobium]OBQ58027.1 hypothetical protein A9K72_27865 [Mesorhizobium loti]QKC63139.1 hypothetical protein EB229_13110 [Mesorhizobium jarvisii]QKD09050.1 hypothetical protein EFV37_13120 [Mesorhizobium loti]RJT30146.1 hypothetical protein D3242_25845 [Mesorhizobium jarvisii]